MTGNLQKGKVKMSQWPFFLQRNLAEELLLLVQRLMWSGKT